MGFHQAVDHSFLARVDSGHVDGDRSSFYPEFLVPGKQRRHLRTVKRMVDGLMKAHLDQYHASGAELVCGNARFIGPRTLQVALRDGGERTLTGERVFVNVGTHAAIPDIPGLADAKPMTHIEALDLQRLPEHLLVLGGGYVGLELAQAMRRFGSRVTLIAREPQLAPKEDADVAQAILA